MESLWLDATEPEGLINIDKARCWGLRMVKPSLKGFVLCQETHLGSGNLLMNSYSLQTTTGHLFENLLMTSQVTHELKLMTEHTAPPKSMTYRCRIGSETAPLAA